MSHPPHVNWLFRQASVRLVSGSSVLASQLHHDLAISFNHDLTISFNPDPAISFNYDLAIYFNHDLAMSFNHDLAISFNHDLDISFNHDLAIFLRQRPSYLNSSTTQLFTGITIQLSPFISGLEMFSFYQLHTELSYFYNDLAI